jgi:hypothetical protein
MNRTATREITPVAPATRQTILNLRVWGARDPGSIRATFALSRPVTSVTVWVQTTGSFEVLTYRHFTARAPETEWEVAFPGLSAGAYDVIVDVPDPGGGEHESWAGPVRV